MIQEYLKMCIASIQTLGHFIFRELGKYRFWLSIGVPGMSFVEPWETLGSY